MSSENAIEVALRNAGWFHGRKHDVTWELELLRSVGFTPWLAVEAFLAEFSGITLEYPAWRFGLNLGTHLEDVDWLFNRMVSLQRAVGVQEICPVLSLIHI